MRLIIDIPEETYNHVCDIYNRLPTPAEEIQIENAIRKGISLPKGHGRLIDADYLKDVSLLHSWHGNNKTIVPYSDRRGYRLRDNEVTTAIINAPTIIESDNKEAE